MAWLNEPPFSLDEATQRSFDVYEVLWRDWGLNLDVTIADAWPPLNGPAIPNSVAAIAIAPRSTVDRCWLTYNILKSPPPPGIGTGAGGVTPPVKVVPPNLAPFTSRLRQISLEAPLLFTQTAQQGAGLLTGGIFTNNDRELATMLVNGSMFVWPQGANSVSNGGSATEIYNPQAATTAYSAYIDIFGAQHVLGANTPDAEVTPQGWIGPLLHLYFYLKAPIITPPTKRAPLKGGSVVNTVAATNSETIVAQIAVFGRKSVKIAVKADQVCNFRVGALRAVNTIAAIPNEEPVDSITALAANTPAVLGSCVGENFFADYLTLYVTPTVGTNPNVTWSVSAYD